MNLAAELILQVVDCQDSDHIGVSLCITYVHTLERACELSRQAVWHTKIISILKY